tara:strand:- start:65 stop:229 length:165 start_codon:yes stop_codon:yes gene_type:complete
MEKEINKSIPPTKIKCYELILMKELKEEYKQVKIQIMKEILDELRDEYKLLKKI